ncbi:MAG: histidine kinase dimerization/phosphoacceptor domain -containing protein [Caldilineaceae bacterium]
MNYPSANRSQRVFSPLTWLILILTSGIIIASATLIILLHQRETESRRLEVFFTRLDGLTRQLSAYEWEMVARGKVSPDLAQRIQQVQGQADSVLKALTEFSVQPQALQQIRPLYQAYITALTEEAKLFAKDRTEQALRLDEERVDPSFTQLSQAIGAIVKTSNTHSAQINHIVDSGYVVLVVVMVVMITSLFWRIQRSRFAAKLAAIKQANLQATQHELELQVQKRTEELTQINEQLQVEIQQRAQIEQNLQKAKEDLEVRVTERTLALQDANVRLELELSERKRAEAQIKTSLQEKEVLLKEVHHRVKNNLQVISSLLYLQSDRIKDQQALEIFRDSQNRVRSMALIHEKLYQAKDLAKIDLSSYLHSLIGYLFRSYGTNASGIRLQVHAENVFLGIDLAMPCGLIINELVSNALKHAFPTGRNGEISIELSRHEPHDYTLCVCDNGIGMPPDVDLENAPTLGLQLVNTLVQQMDGTVELEQNGGTTFKISFVEGK